MFFSSFATIAASQPGKAPFMQYSLVSHSSSAFESRTNSEFSPVLDIAELAWREREQGDDKAIVLHKDKKSRFYMALLMALKNR